MFLSEVHQQRSHLTTRLDRKYAMKLEPDIVYD